MIKCHLIEQREERGEERRGEERRGEKRGEERRGAAQKNSVAQKERQSGVRAESPQTACSG